MDILFEILQPLLDRNGWWFNPNRRAGKTVQLEPGMDHVSDLVAHPDKYGIDSRTFATADVKNPKIRAMIRDKMARLGWSRIRYAQGIMAIEAPDEGAVRAAIRDYVQNTHSLPNRIAYQVLNGPQGVLKSMGQVQTFLAQAA